MCVIKMVVFLVKLKIILQQHDLKRYKIASNIQLLDFNVVYTILSIKLERQRYPFQADQTLSSKTRSTGRRLILWHTM